MMRVLDRVISIVRISMSHIGDLKLVQLECWGRWLRCLLNNSVFNYIYINEIYYFFLILILGQAMSAVVPTLTKVLADPHPHIQSAAKQALWDIGAVVECKEIKV